VPDRLIVDTSPLIFLARAGGLPWLYGACTGTVDIPRGVLAEVAAGADGQLGRGNPARFADAEMLPGTALTHVRSDARTDG
jgi:hypothetical protein